MTQVLIDTCAWIDYFRSTTGQLGNQVAQLIETQQAVLCGVVITELLQGARGKKEQQQLKLLFETIECISINEEDWHSAGIALQGLRRKGITLPVTDALIAAIAQRRKLAILTIDRHFEYLDTDFVSV